MKTLIYGASDDLIEISGSISDEHGCYDFAQNGVSIKCSDGTLAIIKYDGDWHITIKIKGDAFCKLILGSEDGEVEHTDIDCVKENVSAYSDCLIFDQPLEWIKLGNKKYKPQ